MKRFAFIHIMLAACLAAGAQTYSRYSDGLISHITPQGWLHEYLQRQADGLTGHPEAMDYPYNTCLWAGEIERKNENPVAKDWWRYEQTAYYTDGLLRLGYLLGDTTLVGKGEKGVRHTIATAAPDGRLGNRKIESLWPMAVFFRAMQAAYDATGDTAITAALRRNYLSLSPALLAKGRRHILNIEGMLWTYGKTADKRLLQMAEDAYAMGKFELDSATAASDAPIHMHGVKAHGGGRYVERGPLLYAYAIPHTPEVDPTVYANMSGKRSANPDFHCWNLTPSGPYNYGIDLKAIADSQLTVETAASGGYPFDLRSAPVSIILPVRRIDWAIGPDGLNPPTPASARAITGAKTIRLVPYGCTTLRLTVFPTVTE